MVETKFDPFSTDAMDQVQTILNTAQGAQPNTTLSDATISMVGTTPMYSAIRNYYDHDLRLIIVLRWWSSSSSLWPCSARSLHRCI